MLEIAKILFSYFIFELKCCFFSEATIQNDATWDHLPSMPTISPCQGKHVCSGTRYIFKN